MKTLSIYTIFFVYSVKSFPVRTITFTAFHARPVCSKYHRQAYPVCKQLEFAINALCTAYSIVFFLLKLLVCLPLLF